MIRVSANLKGRSASIRSSAVHPVQTCPIWAQLVISAVLLFHMAAILSAAAGAPPSSPVLRRSALAFRSYNDLINQGFGYRYYARLDTTVDPHDPKPWATPIVTAELDFDRPDGVEVLRLPNRERAWPRLRHQRQLDLAYHLASDPRWAASYARHLCKTTGCKRVSIYTQEHRIPDLMFVREAASRRDGPAIDLEAESTYGPRTKLGEFRCDEF